MGFGNNGLAKANLHGANDQKVLAGGDRESVGAGFTDSHWLREAFGTVAYGFFPSRELDSETAARLFHSADERVPVADLELGLRFLLHVARTVCG